MLRMQRNERACKHEDWVVKPCLRVKQSQALVSVAIYSAFFGASLASTRAVGHLCVSVLLCSQVHVPVSALIGIIAGCIYRRAYARCLCIKTVTGTQHTRMDGAILPCCHVHHRVVPPVVPRNKRTRAPPPAFSCRVNHQSPMLYMVCDGHAKSKCAKFVAAALPTLLEAKLSPEFLSTQPSGESPLRVSVQQQMQMQMKQWGDLEHARSSVGA